MATGKHFRTVRPGTILTAAHVNAVDREVERLGRITVGPGLVLSDNPGGIAINLSVAETFYARLTAKSGANYAWTEVIRSGGAWVDGTRSGTTTVNPAIESSGNTAVPVAPTITRVELKRANDGSWVFESSACP